jgi:hypothetical protein
VTEKKEQIVETQVSLPESQSPVAAQKTESGPASSQASQTMELKSEQKSAEPKAKQSKGEKIYDWAVYSGINYWLNLAMSVVITDIFVNRKGRKAIEWGASTMAKGFSKTGIAFDKAHHHSKTALETFMLLSGGNILLIPLKIMEDRKRPIVHWINKKMGVDQTAPDGHELTPDEIYIEKEQPQQSWPRVIGRRILGWIAVVTTGSLLNGALRDRSKPMPQQGQPDINGGKNRTTKYVMGHANKLFNSGYFPGGKWLANNKYAQAYMGFTVLDLVFTKITAVIMHLTNGAGRKKMPHEVGEDEDSPILPEIVKQEVVPEKSFASRVSGKNDSDNLPREPLLRKPVASYAEKITAEPDQLSQQGI